MAAEYEMPPKHGITIAHFLTVADVKRTARFYSHVLGAKLIEEIKALSPRTPAILLSGKVRIYDRDTQADVFLPKGMHVPAELLERIRLLLIRKRGPSRVQPSPEPHPRAGAA